VRALERGGLAAIYSRHRSIRPRPITKLVLDHERVVEAIMARGVVLPLRFGTQLDSEDQLADVLATRREELLRSLERVRGKVELGVRIFAERTHPTRRQAEAGGRSYLLTRVFAFHRCQQAIRDVHAPLAALSAASCVRQPARPPAILAGAYLVDSEHVALFRRRADHLARREPGIRIRVTGPWPPYNFATETRR
jgi:hypothetical protein